MEAVRPHILIAHWADIPWEREVLAPLHPRITHVRDGLGSGVARAALADGDALIVNTYQVTAEMIASMTRCKVISRIGAGLDSVDLAAAAARNIPVCNVPDYCADEVASHAVGGMLMLLRGMHVQMREVQAGRWSPDAAAPLRRISASTAGIIGFGSIGRATVQKAIGVGLRVLVHAPVRNADAIIAMGATAVSMPALLANSDVVSIHAPLNPDTRHLINSQTLALMKPGACLVNCSRGGLVDEAALLDALNAGHVRGALLDVLQHEPPGLDHPLIRHPRVICTAHAAYYSEEAHAELHTRAAEAVRDILAGRVPRNRVI